MSPSQALGDGVRICIRAGLREWGEGYFLCSWPVSVSQEPWGQLQETHTSGFGFSFPPMRREKPWEALAQQAGVLGASKRVMVMKSELPPHQQHCC